MSPADQLRLVALLDTIRAAAKQAEAILGPYAKDDEPETTGREATTDVTPLPTAEPEPMGRRVFMSRVQRGTPRVETVTLPDPPPAA